MSPVYHGAALLPDYYMRPRGMPMDAKWVDVTTFSREWWLRVLALSLHLYPDLDQRSIDNLVACATCAGAGRLA